MAWNPLKAIGNAIGRVFGRGEQAPAPEQQAPPPEQGVPPAPRAVVPERRGGLAGLWDRVTGADRRREVAERERQIEERERQLEERQRQIEEREQAIAPTPPAPPPEQRVPPAPPERDLPKFGTDTDFIGRDERAFGTDSDISRQLDEAVADFIMDRGGLDGLSVDAREWLQSPTISEVFSQYWTSGGFTADQVLAGMTNISNIQIIENEDGGIDIEFDYDADVDGYEVHGHASS